MSVLGDALAEAGGTQAPPTATAGLRRALEAALDQGRAELARKRSGYADPVVVAVGEAPDGLLAAVPVDAALRADPEAASPRSWLLVAATVAALAEGDGGPPPAGPRDLHLRAGDLGGHLLLHLPGAEDPELAVLVLEDRLAGADRLRAVALAVPAAVLADAAGTLRDPVGPGHPLRVAEAVARLGGDPADPASADALEDALGAVLGATDAHARPHEDPDPARRVARRILQRLAGMGKWGGYHTEFAHLPRGFAGNDRALAVDVGEALLQAGVLLEKPSVGQRHVYLNPRRAKDVYAFVDAGTAPPGLTLPSGPK